MTRRLVASLGILSVAAILAAGGKAGAAPTTQARLPEAAQGAVGPKSTSSIVPAAAYKGYLIATSDDTSTPGESLTSVSCPSGAVVGGGMQIVDPGLGDNISGSNPISNFWVAQISNTGSQGSTTIYAICVAKVAKYSVVTSTVDNPAGAQTQIGETCPGKTVVLGGGASTDGTYAPVGVTLNSSFPVSSREWVADMNNTSPEDVTVRGYAICAKKPKGYHLSVGLGTTVPPMAQTGDTATCPSGTLVLSGGGLSHSSSTGVSMESTYPQGSTAWRTNNSNRTDFSTTVVSYAICAAATT